MKTLNNIPCLPRVVSGAFRLHPVTLPELSDCLKGMSSSKVYGVKGITIAMLRRAFIVVGSHHLNVIDSTIISGVIPIVGK